MRFMHCREIKKIKKNSNGRSPISRGGPMRDKGRRRGVSFLSSSVDKIRFCEADGILN